MDATIQLIINFFQTVSQTLTNWSYSIIQTLGLSFSQAWTRVVLAVISLIILIVGFKVSKVLLKIIIVIIGIILLVGFLLPTW